MHQLEAPSLTISTRQEIVEKFWDEGVYQTTDSPQDDCYFEYFGSQCRLARQYDDPHSPICTLRNVCEIVRQMKADETREAIEADLALKLDNYQKNDEGLLSNVINLAIRLWLMMHIGKLPRGVTGQATIAWKAGTLKAAIHEHFQHQLILTDSVKFEKVFNLRNVERIADIKIQWTPNLVDHLKFNEDGKKPVLNIFHHATFLKYHEKR